MDLKVEFKVDFKVYFKVDFKVRSFKACCLGWFIINAPYGTINLYINRH